MEGLLELTSISCYHPLIAGHALVYLYAHADTCEIEEITDVTKDFQIKDIR